MKLDKFDREILRVLQQDATVSMADLSQRVGLSHTPCWRRVKRMEADGIILGKVTLLNSKKTREDALYRGITTTLQSANGKWRRNSPVNILLANGGAKRRALGLLCTKVAEKPRDRTHAIPTHSPTLQP